MGQRVIWQKLKSFGSFLLILLLLPYVVTVFIHGADMKAGGRESGCFVKIKAVDGEGKEQIYEVPWEDYFLGVLGREIPEECEPEFLKAQAVLIRTKIYQTLDSGEEKVLTECYLSPEELKKKLSSSDYKVTYEDLETAMRETENQVLYYQDTYAWVPFHQSGNGMTRSAQEVLGTDQYPYLVLKECPLDKEAEDEMQITTYEYREVQSKCQAFLVAVEKSEAETTYGFSDFEIISYDSAGYVSEMRIGETTCTGDQFRDALSLASSAFSLKDADGRLRITTMGKGHGLGMSQWTANEMAKEGKSYEEILQYFFEGTSLTDGGEIFTKIE